MVTAVYLIEMSNMTPREVALKSDPPSEYDAQMLTLHLEIARAEKRYGAMMKDHAAHRFVAKGTR